MMNSEEAKLGSTCARFAADLRRERDDRLARLSRSERGPAAYALRQSGRAGASLLPRPKRALHQPVLARMITDHRQRSAGWERFAKHGQRPPESAQLVVHGNPQALENPGEIRRATLRAQYGTNGVHQ